MWGFFYVIPYKVISLIFGRNTFFLHFSYAKNVQENECYEGKCFVYYRFYRVVPFLDCRHNCANFPNIPQLGFVAWHPTVNYNEVTLFVNSLVTEETKKHPVFCV